MKYYVPCFQSDSDSIDEKKLHNKIGGIPWGLPANKWPKCEECQKSQTLIAQFLHHPIVLNLGREGRCLYVFMCEHREEDDDRSDGGADQRRHFSDRSGQPNTANQ